MGATPQDGAFAPPRLREKFEKGRIQVISVFSDLINGAIFFCHRMLTLNSDCIHQERKLIWAKVQRYFTGQTIFLNWGDKRILK